jgi:hypothetical protein
MILALMFSFIFPTSEAAQPDLMSKWNKLEQALSGKRTCLFENSRFSDDEFLGLSALPGSSDQTWAWLQRLSMEDSFHPEYEGNEEWVKEMQISMLKQSRSSPLSFTYHDPKTECVIHLSGEYEYYPDSSGKGHARIKSLSALRIAKQYSSGICDPCLKTNSGKYQVIDSHDSSPLHSSEPLPNSVYEKLEAIKKHPEKCK